MANEWTIRGKRLVDGVEEIVDIAVVKELELHDEWMAECFITVSVKSAEPIDWHFDDYLEYRGEVYSISYDPNVVKKARRGTYGEGFTYDNIRFFSLGYKTRNYGFKDVVLYDNQITYTSLATFSFFCSSIEDFADRLQANLNRERQSQLISGWKVLTPSFRRTTQRGVSISQSQWEQYFNYHDESQQIWIEGETDVNIDIDKQNCSEVTKYAYDKFGLAYYMVGTTIIIGGKAVHLNTGAQNIFRYGKGMGLYEIERTSSDDQEIITKLFAYGSEQNLPLNYYAGLTLEVWLNMIIDELHPDGGTANGISVSLESVGFNSGVFTDKIYDFGGIRWYNVDCIIGDIAFGGCIEAVRGNGENPDTTRLIADTNPGSVPGANRVTPEVGRALKQLVANNVPVYFTGGINKNKFPANRQRNVGNMPAALSINRLMLPGFPTKSLDQWIRDKRDSYEYGSSDYVRWNSLYGRYYFSQDAVDPWIKSKNIDTIGLFEGTVNYDGSQQKEIYPTISNTDACTVMVGSNITDNGYVTDAKPFTIEVSNGSLDWTKAIKEAPSPEEVAISMTSGFCTGRDFKVKGASKNSSTGNWVLTLERHSDSSLNRLFPYYDNDVSHYCQILANDTFVVIGIQMPDAYIEAAAEKMLIAACGYLDRRDHMRYTYLPKIDEIFMQRDYDERETQSYHDTIRSGMMLEFEDSDLGIWHSPFIDNLTLKEAGNDGIPTYDVVLRDEKEKTTFEKLIDSIDELMADPPTQVVERQQRVLQYVEYPEWDPNGLYYHETLNTDTDVLETSMVWHKGKKWMCLRTLTTQEPALGSTDWACVEGGNWDMVFTDGSGIPYTNVIPAVPGYVDLTVTPVVMWGQEDISSMADSWEWHKYFADSTEDTAWGQAHTSRSVRLTDDDMPTAWGRQNPVKFKCIATYDDLDIEIEKTVGFGG